MAMLSIWGIILVVIGHSGFTSPLIADRLPVLHNWIYAFHMPLFFFISGYLYSLTNKSFDSIGDRKFLKKKFDRLLVPYLILGVIIFAIKYCFSSLSTADRNFSTESFLYMFIAPQSANSTMGFLWYLITLFLVFVIVRICCALGINLKSYKTCLIISLIFWVVESLLPPIRILNISGVLWYLPFFVLGIIFQINDFKTFISKIGGIALIISVLVFAIVLIFVKYEISSFIFRILAAIIGISASIILCNYLLRIEYITKHILPFSAATYSIYLLSWFGQYPIQILCLNVLHINWFISFILIFLGGIVFPLAVRRCVCIIPKLSNIRILTLTIGY